MSNVENTPSESANLALAAYLEPVLRGQRVLLVDALDGSLTSHLAGKAEVVQVVAPEELAILGSHATAELDLPFDADDFDLIWVAEVADLEEPRARAVDAFRNALARDGVLVMVADSVESETRPRRRRPRDPGEALGRLAAAAFEEVMVLGQSSFEGFALEALGEADGETGLDQSLTGGAQPVPGRYIALASELLPRLESRLVVRTPAIERLPPAEPAGDPEALREAETRAAAAVEEARGLQAELLELEDALRASREKLLGAEDERDAAERLLEEAEEIARDERAASADARDRARALNASLEKLRRDTVDPEEVATLRDEVGLLETRLAETGRRLVESEGEAERRARVARDLLVDLETVRSATQPVPAPGVSGEVQVEALAEREAALYASDELRAELARVREESQARIDELQQELATVQQASQSVEVDVGRAHVPGSGLIPRDTERVRAMGAELLTYRQHAGERDQLAAELEGRRREADEARAFAEGLRLRMEEAERALSHLAPAGGAASGSDPSLQDALKRVDALELELRELDRSGVDHAAVCAERDALLKERSQHGQRLEDLEQALREADDEIDELREERDRARAGLAEARATLQAAVRQDQPG